MSSTNKTTNYQLSQYVGSDKPTYLGDYNGDMSKIDTAIKSVDTKSETAKTTADLALENAQTATEKADGADTKAVNALDKANTADGKASQNIIDIARLEGLINQIKTWSERIDIKAGITSNGDMLISYNEALKLFEIDGKFDFVNIQGGVGNIVGHLPIQAMYPTNEVIIYNAMSTNTGGTINIRIQPNGDITYLPSPEFVGATISVRAHGVLSYANWN